MFFKHQSKHEIPKTMLKINLIYLMLYKQSGAGIPLYPPIVANLFMSYAGSNTFAIDIKPRICLRYTDDNFVIMKNTFLSTFSTLINTL